MQKSKIEWTDYTWNPIKGICPVGCWYCYARRMYQRFGWDSELSLDGELFGSCQDAFAPNIKVDEMLDRIKPGSKIFICSTCELFHPKIHKEWRDAIFQAIKENPQHTFQILTKFPQNIDRPMPNNVWLGVSITKPIEMAPRIKALYEARAKLRFVSFEPLLGDVGQFRFQGWLGKHFDWIIVGKLTGHGHKYDPKNHWITSLTYHAKAFNTPIFLKDNLKEIWGEPLIQEFPCVA